MLTSYASVSLHVPPYSHPLAFAQPSSVQLAGDEDDEEVVAPTSAPAPTPASVSTGSKEPERPGVMVRRANSDPVVAAHFKMPFVAVGETAAAGSLRRGSLDAGNRTGAAALTAVASGESSSLAATASGGRRGSIGGPRDILIDVAFTSRPFGVLLSGVTVAAVVEGGQCEGILLPGDELVALGGDYVWVALASSRAVSGSLQVRSMMGRGSCVFGAISIPRLTPSV